MAKNAAAVALGRLGGSKQVKKGFATMDPDAQRKLAKKGAEARWGKKKKSGAKSKRSVMP